MRNIEKVRRFAAPNLLVQFPFAELTLQLAVDPSKSRRSIPARADGKSRQLIPTASRPHRRLRSPGRPPLAPASMLPPSPQRDPRPLFPCRPRCSPPSSPPCAGHPPLHPPSPLPPFAGPAHGLCSTGSTSALPRRDPHAVQHGGLGLRTLEVQRDPLLPQQPARQVESSGEGESGGER
jgi:hypothetical protein